MSTPATVDRWGIQERYLDTRGQWCPVSPGTRDALVAAMGAEGTGDAAADAVQVTIAGEPRALPPGHALVLEDGTRLGALEALPPDAPIGYHALEPLDGGPRRHLIVAPPRCFLPDGLRVWGWAAQLYAVRSAASWGIGDLGDLGRLARWSAEALGAGAILLSPLGAGLPLPAQQASPYFASSRCYRNPLYLRIEDVPGAAEAGVDLEPLAAQGRALDAGATIDRDAVYRLKTQALERLWTRFGGHPRFEAYQAEQGELLERFAAFNALAEHHGSGWTLWPAEHRHPAQPGVARFAGARAERVRFHAWVQWLLDEQLARASTPLRVLQDFPVGFDLGGADAWAWQDLLAAGVSIGAPPDSFQEAGQDWGLPPFVPHRLRAAGYVPLALSLRAAFRHAGGVRVDHVMGFWRLFWIPRGASPAAGAYVRTPAHELLAVLAVESQRARAIVVGEDLGTVEEGVREEMAARRILSYRLLYFEPAGPAAYPELSLAAVTTHDLPTVAGLWTGADFEEQARLGFTAAAEGFRAVRERLRAMGELADDVTPADAVARAYELLAAAPSAIVMAAVEDALAVTERPNVPGTTTERPNWSLPLPGGLEALEAAPLARRIAGALARGVP